MEQHSEENLLSRWSRRKLQTEQDTQQEDLLFENKQLESQQQNSTELEIKPENSTDNDTEQGDEIQLLTDADMPPVKSLHEDSDFSVFMSAGVSDELRNLALRKLFTAPSFNLRDGLDEYDDDYTSFEKLGDIVTCDMKHQLEMEAKKKLEQEEVDRLNDNEVEGNPELESLEPVEPENVDSNTSSGQSEVSEPEISQPVNTFDQQDYHAQNPELTTEITTNNNE